YGLTNASFLPLAGISAYAALDAGTVLAADVFSTDPPLGKGSKYTVLADPKHVTGFQNVAPIVKTTVVTAAGSTFTNTVNAAAARHSLGAVEVGKVDPQKIYAWRDIVAERDDSSQVEWLESQNAALVRGDAVVTEPGVLRVGEQELRYDRLVIATGSSPVVPP